MADEIKAIPQAEHEAILREKVLGARSYMQVTGGHDHPRAVILSGQPGAGKGNLTATAKAEFKGNIAVIDPDTLRDAHPRVGELRRELPYSWADHTHPDASAWAKELRADAIAQRKHLIIDSTMPKAEVIKDLQAKGYQVEVRAVAAHRLESEVGVDHRFGKGIDEGGFGRYVPRDLRDDVYKKLPGALDDVAKQTGVPVQIYDREGKLHFDSRTSPRTSPGQALETARNTRLTPERLGELHQSTDAQRQWHRDLPERVPNERVSPDTARNLLGERHKLGVEPGVQRLHNEVGGLRAAPSVVKGVGIAGAAYGAYDAKHQVDAAIDTARSNREQWVRGGEESANLAMKTAVTGGAATVGAIPGAAAGTLTSPVTGPVGPIAGGVITGGAAAYGAEKLYEDSRLQQFSKYLGREAGQLGYDYVSKEGRLLRQVNGLNEALQKTTDPAERTRLQGRLAEASTAFGKETERNGRYFEGRAGIDKTWEQMHARFPKVDKDEVNGALDKHIDAGKKPADAVRGAWSDAVHEKYPRALPHQPLENYRAMDNRQLSEQHRRFAGEVAQDRQSVQALAANKDSQNNIDQGWPKSLAQQRQAGRVQEGLNELWRDTGHLGAVRDAMQERGMQPPELPVELRPRDPQAATTRSGQVSLTPEQQRHHALAQEQLSPALSARGHDAETVDRVNAAAVSHAQAHTHRGDVRSFHLSKDGERVAMVQEGAPVSEFSVREAQSHSSGHHLAQAHQAAHEQAQAHTRQDNTRSAEAPATTTHAAPERAMA